MAVIATLAQSSELSSTVSGTSAPNVAVVNVSQTRLEAMPDVDLSAKGVGSVIAYNNVTNTWIATNSQDNQTFNGGSF
jgi:hypothetical protein